MSEIETVTAKENENVNLITNIIAVLETEIGTDHPKTGNHGKTTVVEAIKLEIIGVVAEEGEEDWTKEVKTEDWNETVIELIVENRVIIHSILRLLLDHRRR